MSSCVFKETADLFGSSYTSVDFCYFEKRKKNPARGRECCAFSRNNSKSQLRLRGQMCSDSCCRPKTLSPHCKTLHTHIFIKRQILIKPWLTTPVALLWGFILRSYFSLFIFSWPNYSKARCLLPLPCR